MGGAHLPDPGAHRLLARLRALQRLGAPTVALDLRSGEQPVPGEPADQRIDLALGGIVTADRARFVDLGNLIGGGRLDAQDEGQKGALMVGELVGVGQGPRPVTPQFLGTQ